MAKKSKKTLTAPAGQREHVLQLIDWMSQGVYEKEHIIAMALLCAVAGENMFLLGPPGTAKSMVASRLKRVFKDGRAFDYLMSRFSTPDEIFGPISISRLKNDDRYERLTAGYLPEADVVFLDEIWKAGPSIQNTLLTVINEHIFHNGGHTMRTPMKVLIAASNELPAKDEGLEALWDRFLVRMVSNCIESDSAFFKMIKSKTEELPDLPEALFLTNELYDTWQSEAAMVDISEPVIAAIKALRKTLALLEKDDKNQLRYYISDRRWRKAYRLMQTSAFLNGRREIDMTDYLLLIHCFWNDVECIPNILNAFTASIADATVRGLNRLDKMLRQIMTSPRHQEQPDAAGSQQPNEFVEVDYFYYVVENYPDGDTYFSKWDYNMLTDKPRDGVRYYDSKRKKIIIHALMPGRPFDAASQNAANLQKVTIQKCRGGAMINGTPYAFRRNGSGAAGAVMPISVANALTPSSAFEKITEAQALYQQCVGNWKQMVTECWAPCSNIFISPADLDLVTRMTKEVDEQIKTIEVKLNNVVMLMR